MNNKIVYGLLIIALAIICFFGGVLVKNQKATSELKKSIEDSIPIGGAVHNIEETFDAGIAVDGNTVIDDEGRLIRKGSHLTVASGSWSPSAAQICDNSVISHNSQSSGNITLPSASNLIADCIPDPGDNWVVFFENTTTSSQLDTLVAGTTMDLLHASGSEQTIGANERVLIRFYNIDDASVSTTLMELGDTD